MSPHYTEDREVITGLWSPDMDWDQLGASLGTENRQGLKNKA
jgi:hypothetical protein